MPKLGLSLGTIPFFLSEYFEMQIQNPPLVGAVAQLIF